MLTIIESSSASDLHDSSMHDAEPRSISKDFLILLDRGRVAPR